MQIKLFHIPMTDAGQAEQELNRFLAGHKVLEVEQHFCLNEGEFSIFTRLREIRKQLAIKDGVPAYAVFTDEELAGIAQLSDISETNLRHITGIGAKKAEKYGCQLIEYYIQKGAEGKGLVDEA